MTREELGDLVDEIVGHGEAAADVDAWRALITTPRSGEVWQEAVERRSRMLALSRLVAHRPWLAHTILAVRRAKRRLRAAAPASVTASIRKDLAMATLGPASDVTGDGLTVRAGWGEAVTLPLSVGATVDVGPMGSQSQVFWVTGERHGLLPTRAWTLEAGEAPVALVIIAGDAAEPGDDVVDLLQRHPAAVVVLIEDVGSDGNQES